MSIRQPGQSPEASQPVLEREERNMFFIDDRLRELEVAISRFDVADRISNNRFASKDYFSARLPHYTAQFSPNDSPNTIIVKKRAVSIPDTAMKSGYVVTAVAVDSGQLREVRNETNDDLRVEKTARLEMNPKESVTIMLASNHEVITYAVSNQIGDLGEDDKQRSTEGWVTVLDLFARGLDEKSERLEQQRSS